MTQALLFPSARRWADLELLQDRYARPTADSEPPDPELVIALEELARLREIAALARQVRAAQAAYFKSRTPADLTASKRLERDLDQQLKKELP